MSCTIPTDGMPNLIPPKRVLIVGAGEFGATTALSLIKGPYAGQGELITMLDRSDDPPATDAASSDLNKIIRQEYSDTVYARLAHEAMDLWRTPEWREHYHETGVVVAVGRDAAQSTYISRALAVNNLPGMQTEGKDAYVLPTVDHVKKEYPSAVPLGDFAAQNVYINEAGGWGDARGAVVATIERLRAAGVKFVGGEVQELLFGRTGDGFDVRGVRTKRGESYLADLVILTTGSWTPTLLPELGTELLPTGQVLGTIQLSKEEHERYRDVPVTRMVDNGFYIFPPTDNGVIKFAIHQKGYLNPVGKLPSVPRTALSPGYENQNVPADAVAALKAGLGRVYPELATKQWLGSRICWYSDRPSGDWLIDYHERYPSLFIAAGCCGHGFKFMPILGDLILQGIEGKLPEVQSAIWAYQHRVPGRRDDSRNFSSLKILTSDAASHL